MCARACVLERERNKRLTESSVCKLVLYSQKHQSTHTPSQGHWSKWLIISITCGLIAVRSDAVSAEAVSGIVVGVCVCTLAAIVVVVW